MVLIFYGHMEGILVNMFFGLNQAGMVANWEMSDGSGTTAKDFAGLNNMTITPGTGIWTTQAGLSKGVFSFDGATTVMTGAGFAGLNFDVNQPFSVSIWFSTSLAATAGQGQSLYSRILAATPNTGQLIAFFQDTFFGNGWYPQVLLVHDNTNNEDQLEVYSILAVNTLYNIVVTYNGNPNIAPNGGPVPSQTSFSWYLNGTKIMGGGSGFGNVRTSSLTLSTKASVVPLLGKIQDGSRPFKGVMGPVRIYNDVLTLAEIQAMYLNPYAPPLSC